MSGPRDAKDFFEGVGGCVDAFSQVVFRQLCPGQSPFHSDLCQDTDCCWGMNASNWLGSQRPYRYQKTVQWKR